LGYVGVDWLRYSWGFSKSICCCCWAAVVPVVVAVSLSQAECLAAHASLTLRRRKNMIAAISKTPARITGVNVPTATRQGRPLPREEPLPMLHSPALHFLS
jgi:hypothetical protein